MSLKIPSALAKPILSDGKVVGKLVLDLTVYLVGPTEAELEALIALYESVCPKNLLVKYTVDQLGEWYRIAHPVFTDSGKVAAAAGKKHPYFEPARQAIRDGRSFGLGLWDGNQVADAAGSWSFTCRGRLFRNTGLHSFARFLFPIDADLSMVLDLAGRLADTVELRSGHCGPTFGYDPWEKDIAFDAIYAATRRFWGVEIEDLNATLPTTKNGIKSVNWLTLIGRGWEKWSAVESGLATLGRAGVSIDPHAKAVLLVAGPSPVFGDQNRPDASMAAYEAVAQALAPVFLTAHPDFAGDKFVNNGNTVGWIRRFIEPDGWR